MSQPASADDSRRAGWRRVLEEMAEGTGRAVARFPVPTILLAAAALMANLELGDWIDNEYVYETLCAVLASLSAALFMEARRASAAGRHVVSVLAGIIGFALIEWHQIFSTYEPALIPALVGLVALAPFIGRHTPLAFWLFSLRLLFAGVLAILALILLAGGLSAIFASLSYLFGLPVPDEIHAHVWVSVGLLIAPLFGIGQIPTQFEEPAGRSVPDHLERGMTVLGDYVAAPLLLVYALILHAYAAKIVLTGHVPEGQVGWLVLAFGLCLFGALIVIHPFFHIGRAPTRLLVRIWPVAVPIPIALLLFAVFVRIADYGVTPERYLLAAFAVVAIIATAMQMTRLKGDIRLLAGLPLLALFIASAGPFGAIQLSLDSQASRFAELVRQQPVPVDRQRRALDILDFLNARGALDRVSTVELDPASNPYERFRQVAAANGLDPDFRLVGGRDSFVRTIRPVHVMQSEGYDLILTEVGLGEVQPPVVRTLPDGSQLRLSASVGGIVVAHQGRTVRFDIPGTVIDGWVNDGDAASSGLVLSSGERTLKIYPSFVGGRLSDEPLLDSINGTVLLRQLDWMTETDPGENGNRIE
jgi:hypothetical protein